MNSSWKKDISYNLVLAFGSSVLVQQPDCYEYLKKSYPNAHIIIVSTAGEILDTSVNDDTICVSAIQFENTPIQVVSDILTDAKQSESIGKKLATSLMQQDSLKGVIVFSDGLWVNGSELLTGIKEVLPEGVSLSGGLAGDGTEFNNTFVSLDSIPDAKNHVVMLGLYGDAIEIWTGSVGGWDNFWPKRIITKSEGNIVYEIDDKPALDLYELYLGELAADLPSSWLLFPLSINAPESKISVTRSLLWIDRDAKSLRFAGDVPEGYFAQLMKANFDRVINGSETAAQVSKKNVDGWEFALLISCVGRKLVLKQRVEEEVESIRFILGSDCVIGGFYSYGEIWPSEQDILDCQLHNQTMTMTLLQER